MEQVEGSECANAEAGGRCTKQWRRAGGRAARKTRSGVPGPPSPPPAFLGRCSRRPALTQGRDPDLRHPAGQAKPAGGTPAVPRDPGARDPVPATRA